MKHQLSMLAAGVAVMVTTAFALPAQAAGIGFVPVRLAPSQGLRIGLSNLADTRVPPDPIIPPDPVDVCHGTLVFYDAPGNTVGTERFALAPGRSLHVAMAQPTAALLASRTLVTRRVVIRFLPPDPVFNGDASFPPDPCRAVYAGEEIFDTQTNQTQFMNPGVIRGFNPQPDPPGFGGVVGAQ